MPLASEHIPARGCGRTPTAHVSWSGAEIQFVAGFVNAPGKASGSTLEKLPWPSLRRIATG
jgi:hypothetical protein